MKSPGRGMVGLQERWLVHMFSSTAQFFLLRAVQTFCSFERLQRYNVQLNWAVRESNSRYRRLFARIRLVTSKEWSNVVESNRCTVHSLRRWQLSAH